MDELEQEAIARPSPTARDDRLLNAILGVPLTGMAGALFWLTFIIVNPQERAHDVMLRFASAIAVEPGQVAASYAGRPVAVTGVVSADAPLGDAYLAPVPVAVLRRDVLVYASRTHTEGTSSKKTKTVQRIEWGPEPVTPPPHGVIADGTLAAPGARLGGRPLAVDGLTLEDWMPLALDGRTKGRPILLGGIYVGKNAKQPALGDRVLTYRGVPVGKPATLFGAIDAAGRVTPHRPGDALPLYRLCAGGREAAIRYVVTSTEAVTWILRALGTFFLSVGALFASVGLHWLVGRNRGLGLLRSLAVAVAMLAAFVQTMHATHQTPLEVAAALAVLALGIVLFSRPIRDMRDDPRWAGLNRYAGRS